MGATRIAAAAPGLSPRKFDHAAGLAPEAAIAPFSNGQLHYLLTNPVYRGLIRHKSLIHPGQQALRGYLRIRARQHDMLLHPEASTAGLVAEALHRLSGEMAAQDLWPLISEVHITAGSMIIHLSREALAESLGLHPDALNPDALSIQQAFQRRRRGAETRLVSGTVAPQPDPVLQQNLARAHRWADQLRRGESLSSIARAENCSDSLVRSRVALAFLAPDLQRAIREGTAPSHLTTHLIVRTTLPQDWQAQPRLWDSGSNSLKTANRTAFLRRRDGRPI